jgi:hypothetical protein
MAESGLAHQADCHDASGHAHVDPRIFQLLGSLIRVFRQNSSNGVRELVLGPVRGLAQRLDLFQFLTPQFVNVFVECQENPLKRELRLTGAERRMKTLKRDYKQPARGGAFPPPN